MPKVGPIARRKLIQYLRALGFSGPFEGGRHEARVGEPLTHAAWRIGRMRTLPAGLGAASCAAALAAAASGTTAGLR